MNCPNNPVVIQPPGFSQEAAWKQAAEYGDDPGTVSCPACHTEYWAWGSRQRCAQCDFEYQTDWFCWYAWGVNFTRPKSPTSYYVKNKEYREIIDRKHDIDLGNFFYRYGFENPVDSPYHESSKIDWRSVFERYSLLGNGGPGPDQHPQEPS